MSQMRSSGDAGHLNQYRITIQGHLHPRWAERFEEMQIIQVPDGTTTLIVNLPDQAALYGLIIRLRDMGLTLLSVETLVIKKN